MRNRVLVLVGLLWAACSAGCGVSQSEKEELVLDGCLLYERCGVFSGDDAFAECLAEKTALVEGYPDCFSEFKAEYNCMERIKCGDTEEYYLENCKEEAENSIKCKAKSDDTEERRIAIGVCASWQICKVFDNTDINYDGCVENIVNLFAQYPNCHSQLKAEATCVQNIEACGDSVSYYAQICKKEAVNTLKCTNTSTVADNTQDNKSDKTNNTDTNTDKNTGKDTDKNTDKDTDKNTDKDTDKENEELTPEQLAENYASEMCAFVKCYSSTDYKYCYKNAYARYVAYSGSGSGKCPSALNGVLECAKKFQCSDGGVSEYLFTISCEEGIASLEACTGKTFYLH